MKSRPASSGSAGKAGELSRTEQQLLNAVFQFDDLTVRQSMAPVVPRRRLSRRNLAAGEMPGRRQTDAPHALSPAPRHTRRRARHHPREGAHRTGKRRRSGVELHRPPRVARTGDPANQPASARDAAQPPAHGARGRRVRHPGRHRHHGERCWSRSSGAVQDEFDSEAPDITREDPLTFRVRGQVLIERVNRECGLDLYAADVDTLSGLLVSHLGRLAETGGPRAPRRRDGRDRRGQGRPRGRGPDSAPEGRGRRAVGRPVLFGAGAAPGLTRCARAGTGRRGRAPGPTRSARTW